jgi:hypothetical protein
VRNARRLQIHFFPLIPPLDDFFCDPGMKYLPRRGRPSEAIARRWRVRRRFLDPEEIGDLRSFRKLKLINGLVQKG